MKSPSADARITPIRRAPATRAPAVRSGGCTSGAPRRLSDGRRIERGATCPPYGRHRHAREGGDGVGLAAGSRGTLASRRCGMRVGTIVPQGWTGEYDGWDASRAWARSVAIAHEAETLGFESLWLFDHVQTEPVPTDQITFEAFVGLSALAGETARVRLGHLVLCAGYRNPALVAKMISPLDVVSGGGADLALGAGWKEDEYAAYGFGFPPLRERMALLEDSLYVVTRMLAPGRATYVGTQASVTDAINMPKGVQQP